MRLALLAIAGLLAASCSSPEPGVLVTEPIIQTRLVATPEGLPDKLGPITIHAVGDLLAHESVAVDGRLDLTAVADLFSDDAITIGNLECPASDAGSEPVSGRLTCDPELLGDLAAGGLDVLSLANDRSVDRGRQALVETIDAVEAAGLEAVGAGTRAAEAYDAAIVESDGWRIAVIGTTAVGSNFASAERAGTAPIERTDPIVNAIARVRDDVDLVLVTVHWGRPLDRDPEPRDRGYADTLIGAGADVVFGHGPHRLQSFALVEQKPVFWSLGHFLWPQAEPADADSAIGRVEIAADGTTVVCLVPATLNASGTPSIDRLDPSCT